MSAAESSLAVNKFGDVNPRYLERFDADAGEHDINDRIECADFMKLNFFDRHAMMRVSLC